MKNFIKIFSLIFLGATLIFSCAKDELDIEALTDFPPGILSVSPGDGSKVVIGNFNIKIEFVDGTVSPLASGEVKLSDALGNELASASQGLSGTRDSIVIEGSAFNAELLGPGVYNLAISVTDSKGQSSTRETSFEISLLPFAANYDAMYLSGVFNNWPQDGSDAMTLVADHTWEIQNIDMQGGEWKLKNCATWCDKDWGDPDCDGIVEETTGGGPNSACSPSGLVNFRFNDQTLAYTITPAVNFATNISGLYLLGSFNNFEGEENKFSLVADNTWELPEVLLKSGDLFKFAEYPSFMGRNWGDADGDGTAEEFGSNISFTASDAIYKITFNDKSLAYTIEFVRGLFPDNLYLVGGLAAHGSWTPGQSIPFNKVADGVFEIYAPAEAGTGFKFLQVQDWAGDWGCDPNNPGYIIQEGEQDCMVSESGFYLIRIDFNDKSVTLTKTDWGLIGSATPGGWDTDTNMTLENNFDWTVTLDLVVGAIKFRANDDWPINFGDTGLDGTLERDGTDIPVTEAGNYTITMSLHPVNGYTYEMVKN
ncbi:MAG: SusF/SusE family outer membrane protein [Phaeodactylibacter sp.]|nr:SusF/SusE family outer membrane protein [Phaeodactylibacter sp.]MCB9275969.1 SusF/SusE family outer membrane protein [Lewinellaceae bacterium]